MMQGSWNGSAQMSDPKDILDEIINRLATNPELLKVLMEEVLHPEMQDKLWRITPLPGETGSQITARLIKLAKDSGRFVRCDKKWDSPTHKLEIHREIIQKLKDDPRWFFALYSLFANFIIWFHTGDDKDLSKEEQTAIDMEVWKYIQYQFDLMITVTKEMPE